MPQLKQIDERIHDTELTRRRNAMAAVKPETYMVYSIYHLDDPQGGYAVYSHDQRDWDFVGYMPAVDSSHLSQNRISCRENDLL
jgi:hypothetical protein